VIALVLGPTRVRVVFGEKADGGDAVSLMERGHGVRPNEVAWVRQVHGRRVAKVPFRPPVEADGVLVPGAESIAAAIRTADCMPLVLAGANGSAVLAHVGWPGLVGGMVQSAVAALGQPVVAAAVGPHVHPCCYEFLGPSRQDVLAALGEGVFDGTALVLVRGLRQALAEAGVTQLEEVGGCTGCDPRWCSWRQRRDTARNLTVVMPWTA
jgi:copper oxidase (laccase) domain-containing protein